MNLPVNLYHNKKHYKRMMKIYYDKKINRLQVKIGDNVFLLKGGKIKKLDDHYTGPYEVYQIYQVYQTLTCARIKVNE